MNEAMPYIKFAEIDISKSNYDSKSLLQVDVVKENDIILKLLESIPAVMVLHIRNSVIENSISQVLTEDTYAIFNKATSGAIIYGEKQTKIGVEDGVKWKLTVGCCDFAQALIRMILIKYKNSSYVEYSAEPIPLDIEKCLDNAEDKMILENIDYENLDDKEFFDSNMDITYKGIPVRQSECNVYLFKNPKIGVAGIESAVLEDIFSKHGLITIPVESNDEKTASDGRKMFMDVIDIIRPNTDMTLCKLYLIQLAKVENRVDTVRTSDVENIAYLQFMPDVQLMGKSFEISILNRYKRYYEQIYKIKGEQTQ